LTDSDIVKVSHCSCENHWLLCILYCCVLLYYL
jgi:hypothetical protein